jgi:hypothetical protein
LITLNENKWKRMWKKNLKLTNQTIGDIITTLKLHWMILDRKKSLKNPSRFTNEIWVYYNNLNLHWMRKDKRESKIKSSKPTNETNCFIVTKLWNYIKWNQGQNII